MKLESLLGEELVESMGHLARTAPSGCFVEVGVYKGGSAQKLYEIAQEQGREIYLFDTFTGIPIKSGIDHHKIGDFADVDLDLIRKELPLARIYIGIFPHTIPGDILKSIAFVHVDCDQYESVRSCIMYLYPRMVTGGIMLFDDYDSLDGAKKAVTDYFKDNEIFTNNGKAYVLK